MNNKLYLSITAACTLAANSLLAVDNKDLGNISVSSGNFKTTELDSTASVEIYTKKDIQKSKSINIYEFLNEQSSVVTMPASGNIFTQKLDLRGYGITDGYQNIVVVVDGRRLNNPDMTPQLLSSIPLNTIETIEILKGNGSVRYGDNATAGVINITTNGKYKNSISGFYGSNSTKSGTLLLGYNNDKVIINGILDHYSTDGARKIDTDGNTDKKSNKNKKIDLKYFPTLDTELRASRSWTKINNIYANGILPTNFKNDPTDLGKLSGGKYYSSQVISSYVTTIGGTYFINPSNQIDIDFSKEKKVNDNPEPWNWKSEYEIKNLQSVYKYKNDQLKLAIGMNKNKNLRIGSTNETTKNNTGIYFDTKYNFSTDTTLDSGIRYEEVEYIYKNNTGTIDNQDKEYLTAYNFGINHLLNNNQSIFANYNKAFQAPDIDRFFNFGGAFNGFIKPAITRMTTVGFNDFRINNKLKLALFYARLKNEIYYHKTTFTNTNIDKSHKYGLELYNKYKINQNYYISGNYNYIIAKIDEEARVNGAYDGKYLPGVSKHNITLNFGATYDKLTTVLSHTYRSSTYHSEDFENSDTNNKQKAYKSTNLNIDYQVDKKLNLFAKVNNIFDYKNGVMSRDATNTHYIYPINFERTFYAGLKYNF